MEKRFNLKHAVLFLTLLILVFLAVTTVANGFAFFDFVKIGYFYFGGWVLPGMAFLVFFNFRHLTFVELFGLGCAIGYCMNLAVYFLLFPLGYGHFTVFLVPMIGLLSIAILVIKRKYFLNLSIDIKGFAICVMFLLGVQFLRFFVFDMVNILPDVTPVNEYYQDLLFWIENSVGLSKSYPPVNMRMDGFKIYYHYFSSMQMTVMNLATGISFVKIGLHYQYLMSSILLSFGAYMLAKSLIKKNSYTIVFMIIVLFCVGKDSLSQTTYGHHLHIAPFGFDVVTAISFFVLFLFLLQVKNPKFDVKVCFLTILMFVVLTGTKGSTAMVMLPGIAVICAFWLFKERKVKQSLLYGLGSLLGFVLVYVFVLTPPQESTSRIENAFVWFWHIQHHPPMLQFYEALSERKMPIVIAQIITIIQWLLWSNLAIYVFVFLGIVLSLIVWKKIDIIQMSLFAITFAGALFTLMLKHNNSSQMYYIMTSFPFALLFGLYCVYKNHDVIFSNKIQKTVFGYGLIFVILTGLLNSFDLYAPFVLEGYYRIRYRETIIVSLTENRLTRAEYDALMWLKDNSSSNAVVASNRLFITEKNVDFIVGAFSERLTYLEGFAYMINGSNEEEAWRRYYLISEAMAGNSRALKQLKNEGVNYLMQFKRLNQSYKGPSNMGKLVYDNDEVSIFSLN